MISAATNAINPTHRRIIPILMDLLLTIPPIIFIATGNKRVYIHIHIEILKLFSIIILVTLLIISIIRNDRIIIIIFVLVL